jgi:hypothetical protein
MTEHSYAHGSIGLGTIKVDAKTGKGVLLDFDPRIEMRQVPNNVRASLSICATGNHKVTDVSLPIARNLR